MYRAGFGPETTRGSQRDDWLARQVLAANGARDCPSRKKRRGKKRCGACCGRPAVTIRWEPANPVGLALTLMALAPQKLSLLVLAHLLSAPLDDTAHGLLPQKGRKRYLFAATASSGKGRGAARAARRNRAKFREARCPFRILRSVPRSGPRRAAPRPLRKARARPPASRSGPLLGGEPRAHLDPADPTPNPAEESIEEMPPREKGQDGSFPNAQVAPLPNQQRMGRRHH